MTTVLVGPDDAREIIYIRHPRTAKPSRFLLSGSGDLYEVLALTPQNKQSMFLGTEIVGDTVLHVATRFDSTFILLAALQNQTDTHRFVEVDDMLELLPIQIRERTRLNLPKVCEPLENVEDYWKLCDTRAIGFVQNKVARTQLALPSSILDKLPSADPDIVSLAQQKAALELISSYLTPTFSQSITKLYDFTSLDEFVKAQKTQVEVMNPSDFIQQQVEGEDSVPEKKKPKKGSKGVEALKKVNTKGMSSISSFFTKK